MLKEMLYYPADTVLTEERAKAKELCYDFNQCRPSQGEKRVAILKELLGKTGENVWMEQPIYFDYGSNTEVGENFFANANCVILDVAKVTIGKNVMFAPNVSIYTAGHPLHPETRNSGWEYGIGISIGDNVWVGGNVVINPGVHIGKDVYKRQIAARLSVEAGPPSSFKSAHQSVITIPSKFHSFLRMVVRRS